VDGSAETLKILLYNFAQPDKREGGGVQGCSTLLDGLH